MEENKNEAWKKAIIRLEKEVSEIFLFASELADTDVEALLNRLSQVNAYIARTGEMMAESRYLLTIMKSAALDQVIANSPLGFKMSANEQKIRVEAACAYPISVDYKIERCNRALVHIGDNLRTQISFVKEDMTLTRNGR